MCHKKTKFNFANKPRHYFTGVIFLAIIFLGLFGLAENSEAKNLYVNNSGSPACSDSTTYANNDANNPWCILGRAVWGSTARSSPNSSQAAQAGDIVNVTNGIYTTTEAVGLSYIPIYNPANSGTAGNYITFQCVSGVCDLRASTTGDGEPVAGAYQRNYIKWVGFYIDQDNMNFYTDMGIMSAQECNHVEFHNNEIRGRYIDLGDNPHSCIRIHSGEDIVIKNNKLYGSTGTSGENDAGIIMYATGTTLIEHNEIYDNTTGIHLKQIVQIVGTYPDNPSVATRGKITIRLNNFYNNSGDGVRVGRALNGEIYQNIFRGNGDAVMLRYTVPDNPATPDDYLIINNTFVNNTRCAFRTNVMDTSQILNSPFWNNIVYGGDHAIYTDDDGTPVDPDFEHNLYYGWSVAFGELAYTNRDFTYWKETSNQDSVSPASLNSDPLFVNLSLNNFRLQGGSPAINAGIDILDLNNNGQTNDAITLGAYITGNETIGLTSSGSLDTTPPASPSGLTVQ